MTTDRAAFESAIAANPADLTARLVYADLLDETGDPADAARAEFVRAQIEADALPPEDDHRRALVGRSVELFTGYWIDWWGSVCATVGLPVPRVLGGRPLGRVARVARMFAAPRPIGWPYRPDGVSVRAADPPAADGPVRGLMEARFARGWPEELVITGDLSGWAIPVRLWAAALPLTGLELYGSVRRDWAAIAGEHLRPIRRLRLFHCRTDAVQAITASTHLPEVTDLDLQADRSHPEWPLEQNDILADSPLASRLERLTVHLARLDEAGAIIRPDGFARLTDLTVRLEATAMADWAGALETLAGAPFISRLESFTLDPWPTTPGIPPEAEPALLRILGALDPDRVKRIDLRRGVAASPAVAELLAERFGMNEPAG
jgi:uncharacterized protein (TIGR02996 family)